MSFKFNWQFFNVADLQKRCKDAFTASVASTRRPPSIAEPIRATDINFGSQPPEIVFREIKAVSLNRTHLVFSVKYSGDASITLETAVHANPLLESFNESNFFPFVQPKLVAALTPFVLPFELKIQHVVLDTLINVIYTPQGVIITFGDDPIKHLEVQTSLDMIPMLNAMIAQILKVNLEVAFEEDIPESVWASTNPDQRPPDPFFGALRWSQHTKQFTKFSHKFFQPLGPKMPCFYTPYFTLALQTSSKQFQLPCAIPNRAYLPPTEGSRRVDKTVPRDPLLLHKNQGLRQFLTETSSLSSSMRTSSASSMSEFKPKRRVINLRKLSQRVEKNDDKKKTDTQQTNEAHSGTTQPDSTPQSPERPSRLHTGFDPEVQSLLQPPLQPEIQHDILPQLSEPSTPLRNERRRVSVRPNMSSRTPSRGPSRSSSRSSPKQHSSYASGPSTQRSPSSAARSPVLVAHSPPSPVLGSPNLRPKSRSRSDSIKSIQSLQAPSSTSSPSLLPTALADESAIQEELLPSILEWDHHRSVSTPGDVDVVRRMRNMEKRRSTPLHIPKGSASTSRRPSRDVLKPPLPFDEGPRRYASTNDLIDKFPLETEKLNNL